MLHPIFFNCNYTFGTGATTVMRTKILRPVADSYLGAPLATNNDDSEGQADLRGV